MPPEKNNLHIIIQKQKVTFGAVIPGTAPRSTSIQYHHPPILTCGRSKTNTRFSVCVVYKKVLSSENRKFKDTDGGKVKSQITRASTGR